MSTQTNHILIGSRGSELARWQSDWIADQLRLVHPGVTTEVTMIKTTGDKILDAPLSKIGDKGLFTKELDAALLDGRIDLAVHSLKDVPTRLEPGLTLGAVCKREDVRDVFITHPNKRYRSFRDVPHGGIIATGSLRRRCQLLALRPDLKVAEIRGNISTRIAKLEKSEWDGMLMARAGLMRLGWGSMITEILEPTTMLPAVGQGALAVEVREQDARMRDLVYRVNDLPTEQATASERTLLGELEGGCQIPIGAYGRIQGGVLKLDAMVGSLDGRRTVRGRTEGSPDQAESLGRSLANELLSSGAKEILEEIRRQKS